MVPTHVDVANREHKRKVQNYGKEKDLYKRGTVGKNAERMNKLGEWYFSDDPNKLHVVIHDMRAVLR